MVAAAALVAASRAGLVNFPTTARWAAEPGALHGWRKPWYGLARCRDGSGTRDRATIGEPIRLPRSVALGPLAAGAAVLMASCLARLPLSSWTEIPFKDDWTPLFQHAVNA